MICTAAQADGQTTYSIPELHRAVRGEESRCSSAWINGSDFVIANHEGVHVEPVMSSNFSTLVTSRCIGNVTFSGTCTHQGTPRDYRASCSTVCAAEALIEDEGNSWISVVAVVVSLLLLACLLGFLWYKYKIWRRCRCSLRRCFYSAVKSQEENQAAPAAI